MLRQKLNINNNTFLIEYNKYKEDKIFISKKFVFIRRYYIMNNVIYDTDIYIIEREIINDVIDEINNSENGTSTLIVFPFLENKKSAYSNYFKKFNSSFNKERFQYKEKEYSDIYDIIDKNGESIFIPCDEIKIYHPTELHGLDSIIHIDSYYNDIHFHFYCNLYDNTINYSDEEIILDNNIYSEYNKIYIPDIEYLFFEQYINITSEDGEIISTEPSEKNTYFIEDLSFSEIENDIEDINDKIIYLNNKKLIPFNILLKPFKIEKINIEGFEDIDIYKKVYIDIFKTIENNYLTSPINLTIYPYININKDNNIYILNSSINPATVTFFEGYKFRISSELGFDKNGLCSVISNFKYFNEDKYTIQEAYSLYNNVNKEKYKEAREYLYRKYYRKAVYDKSYNYYPKSEEDGLEIGYPYNFEKYDEYNKETKDDDYIIDKTNIQENDILENNDEILLIGYAVEIASDIEFKNILFKFNVNQEYIDNFTFNLTNIFNGWKSLPDVLVGRCIFIDRYLGKIIIGNRFVITKEWYKYLVSDNIHENNKEIFAKIDFDKMYYINPEDKNDVEQLKESEKTINLVSSGDNKIDKNNLINEDFMNVNKGFNFIDKINCTIKKENEEKNIESSLNNGINNIFYKTIFYRVKDLQNIRIKSGLSQNIGVNLVDYMTRVESFKMIIEGITYIEIARNDIYVIFKINANEIIENTGRYIITNEEDEYISDGVYTLY